MFLGSGPDLVVACCNAGVLGSFPALNARSSAGFEAWLSPENFDADGRQKRSLAECRGD